MTVKGPSDQEDAVAAVKPGDYKLLWGCLAVTVLLVLLWCGFYLARIREEGQVQIMSRAKGTLRSIGTAQLSYRNWNGKGIYGSFHALYDPYMIGKDITLDNIVDAYTMTWEVGNISTAPTDELPSGIISTFTIIAYPDDPRRGKLATYAITEDQVVRVYDPGHCDVDDVRTWDPIL